MKHLLKKYSDENPEKFNHDFIMSRDKEDLLECIKDTFKTLEVLDEIEVLDVSINTDEASFGPIKAQHSYYKSTLPSRFDKIHYKVRITPNENIVNGPIELGKNERGTVIPTTESFIREGDIYINKLIDNVFYINEGIRYYLIYQIVDNATYGTEDAVSLKTLLMPVTLKQTILPFSPEFGKPTEDLKSFNLHLFDKKVSPIIYKMALESYNKLAVTPVGEDENTLTKWQSIRDESLIDKFNEFYGTDFKFSDDLNSLETEGRTIFRVTADKPKAGDIGCYISVSEEKLANDPLTRCVLGSLLDLRKEVKNSIKRKKILFTYDQFISPWFWIDLISGFFTSNTDYLKKFNKVRTILISLNRLVDETIRKILKYDDEDKKNVLTIVRYIMKNFDELMNADSQNLEEKRLRLQEYQLYPLRKYFSEQIYRIINSTTRSKMVLDKIFSSFSPMFVVKQTIQSDLLRYYNAPNEIDLFTALLKYTFRGPQSLAKTVTITQRDLHPSYAGRISLVASSAGDPGMSGTLSCFAKVYKGGYFKDQEKKAE